MNKKKNVLVLGGAGLIGSYLVEKLAKKKYKVLVVDDFSKGHLKYLKNIKKKIKIIKIDLETSQKLSVIFKDYPNIFHLASRAYGVGYSKGNHKKIFNHNKRITNNIIKQINSNVKYFQCVSSSCVYRDTGPSKISEKFKLNGYPEKANLGYGLAKRYLEKKMLLVSKKFKFDLSIIRPFNIYGERYNWQGKYSQAIPMLVNKVIKSKKEIEIWGSGKQQRNYLHASDCAEIMIKIFDKKYTKTPINIGYEDTIKIKDLVLKIGKLVKKKLIFKFDTSKPEGRFIKSSNSHLLKKITDNFKPRIKLNDGLKLMIKWHKQNFK